MKTWQKLHITVNLKIMHTAGTRKSCETGPLGTHPWGTVSIACLCLTGIYRHVIHLIILQKDFPQTGKHVIGI